MYASIAIKHLDGEVRSNYGEVRTEVNQRDYVPTMVREEIDNPETDLEATDLESESHGIPWDPISSSVRNANKRRQPILRQIIHSYRGK